MSASASPAAPDEGWGRSLVAGVNALFRREESRLPPAERLLHDPWARWLAETHPAVWAIRLLRYGLPPLRAAVAGQWTAHVVRHRTIDALLWRALCDGFAQVVLIGAGYDMRASRFGAAFPEARWFEVDRPAVAERKWRRLAGAPGLNRGVRRVPLELGRAALGPALEAAGFEPDRPALFVMEGLIHYLKIEDLKTTLQEISGPGPRRLALSFIDPGQIPLAGPAFRGMVRLLREIPRLSFTPAALAALLHSEGWGGFVHYGWEDQVRCFAPGASRRAAGRHQDVALAARGPAPRAG